MSAHHPCDEPGQNADTQNTASAVAGGTSIYGPSINALALLPSLLFYPGLYRAALFENHGTPESFLVGRAVYHASPGGEKP
jgi:hypothetical protein